MCIGCRARRPQADLVRCALGPCSLECFDTAVRRRAFTRALRHEVPTSALTALRIPLDAVITNMRDLQVAGTGHGTPTPDKAEQEG
jgi:predicted RNA-binding protein YlxR (DUF448 family)